MLPEAEGDFGNAGEGSEMEALGLLWGWTLPKQNRGHTAGAVLQPHCIFQQGRGDQRAATLPIGS